MTDPIVRADRPDTGVKLATLRLPELQALAADLGISGASKLRKGVLVDTISEIQSAQGDAQTASDAPKKRAPRRASASAGVVTASTPEGAEAAATETAVQRKSAGSKSTDSNETAAPAAKADKVDAADKPDKANEADAVDKADKPENAATADKTGTADKAEPSDKPASAENSDSKDSGDASDGSDGRAQGQRNRNRNRNRSSGDRQPGDRHPARDALEDSATAALQAHCTEGYPSATLPL